MHPPDYPINFLPQSVPPGRWRTMALIVGVALGWAGVRAGAQTPVITALSPSSGQPGDTVTITGTNISTSSDPTAVLFGAERATILSTSSTQTRVQVPSGATFGPVTLRVVGGKTAYSPRPFVPTFSPSGQITDHAFGQTSSSDATNKPPALVTFSTGTSSLTTGSVIVDLDGDGKPDLIVAEPGDYSVRILRNTHVSGALSSASFTTAANLQTGVSSSATVTPVAIAYGNLAGTNVPDLVIANNSGGGTGSFPAITILQNVSKSGTISFLSAFSLPLGTGSPPSSVQVVDVDGDGWPDIVCSGQYITVYRNRGLGGTLSASSFETGVVFRTGGSSTSDLAVADLDGDGKPDLIVTGYPTGFYLLRNLSTAGVINLNSFAAAVQITTPNTVSAVAAADLNGDGKPEVIAGSSGGVLYVYPNASTAGSLSAASFGTRVDLTVPNYASILRLSVADLNGDGFPEVVMTSRFSPGVLVAVNSGSGNVATALGSFVALSIPAAGESGPGALMGHAAIGDLNANGKPDLVVDGPQGSFSVSENFVVPLTVNSLAVSPASATVTVPWYRATVLTASEGMSDGSTINVSNAATWTSANPGVATVNATGTVTGVAAGTTTIQAAYEGRSAQTTVNVNNLVFGTSPGNPDGAFLPVVSNGGVAGAVYALAVQGDGKVVIGGQFTSVNGVARNNLARINDDGTLDTDFNPGTGPNGTVFGLALDGSGRVLVAGQFTSYNGTTRRAVARVSANGALDTAFDAGLGSGTSRANVVSLRPDGRILIGGYVLYPAGSSTSTYLTQVNTDGSPDTTFAAGTASGELNALALQTDGSVLIGGSFSNTASGSFCLERLVSSGAFDGNFQIGIKAGRVYGFALQGDGKVVTVGDFSKVYTQSISFITRFSADGTLDDNFSKTVASGWGIVKGVALQKNGRIVVTRSFYTQRLNGDGTPDSTYNAAVHPDWDIDAVTVGANEKIWEAGGISAASGVPTLGIARLQGDVSTFLGWQARYFTAAQISGDPARYGANGDAAGDGIANLDKYAFGVDAFQSAVGKIPVLSSASASATPGTGFDFTYRKRLQGTDLLYEVGVSYDLQTWDYTGSQLSAVGTPTVNPDGLTQNITVRLSPPANTGQAFLRLRVSQTP